MRGESLPPSLKRQAVFDIPPSSGDTPQRPLSRLASRAFFNLASRLQDSPALSRLGNPFGIRPPQPPHHTRHHYSLTGIPNPRTACAARAPSNRTRHPWRDSSCLSGFCAFPLFAGNTLKPFYRAQGIPQYVRTRDIPCHDPTPRFAYSASRKSHRLPPCAVAPCMAQRFFSLRAQGIPQRSRAWDIPRSRPPRATLISASRKTLRFPALRFVNLSAMPRCHS